MIPLRAILRFAATVTVVAGLGVLPGQSESFSCFDKDAVATLEFETNKAEILNRNHAPWMVNISLGGSPFCGGTLISPRYVLTAAHCLKYARSSLVVRTAAENGSAFGDSRKVKALLRHHNYNSDTDENDVAVLQLETAFENVPVTRLPLMLPESHESSWALPGHCAKVMGWGSTVESENASEELLSVNVPIWDQDDCKTAHGDNIKESSLCAGYAEGQFDSCAGDSGGPLLVEGGQTGVWLVGVVSWGRDCGLEGYPGVYARSTALRSDVYGMVDKLERLEELRERRK